MKKTSKFQEVYKRTKTGNIIGAVNEKDWTHDGYIGEGTKNKKKTYNCKLCEAKGIRSDNRKVHFCN
jgi:hypothetical protein